MLININKDKKGQNAVKGNKLPKLKTVVSSKRTACKGKTFIDDTARVSRTMEQLFSSYNWRVVITEEEAFEFINLHDELGFDTETTGLDLFKSNLVGVSFATPEECIYIPLTHKRGANYEGNFKDLEKALSTKKLYGFNAKFDIKALKLHAGTTLRASWCGYLAARLMNSAEPSNELKELYVKYVDPDDRTYSFRGLFSNPFDEYDPAIVGGYAAVDALKHIRLGKWQEEHMEESDLKIMTRIELPLAHELVDIELRGIELDLDWCNALIAELSADLEKIKAEFEDVYPGFNPGSPKQVASLLFDQLKLPMINGRGTGENVLSSLNHPLADKVLEYRTAQKLLSTYASKMPADADDGVIHTVFNQYGADTGRFSSSNPNLQNIPRDPRFRKMFRAREGHLLASCDYTQQEVYILASLADDQTMKDAYMNDMDFYAYMASLVYAIPYEECLKGGRHAEYRNQMKSVVLGVNYDMGIETLAKDIGKSIPETRAIYNKFFETCSAIKPFRQSKLDFAVKHGYVETILGRKRRMSAIHLPDFASSDKDVEEYLNKLRNKAAISKLVADARKEGITVIDRRKQKAYEVRQVVNSAVQGSAADMTKLAVVIAAKDEKLKELGGQILLLIHDEIIAEFPEEHAEEGAKRLTEIMVDVGSDLIGIPMKSEPKVMRSWE